MVMNPISMSIHIDAKMYSHQHINMDAHLYLFADGHKYTHKDVNHDVQMYLVSLRKGENRVF